MGVPLYFGWVTIAFIALVDAVWMVISGHTIVHTTTQLLIVAAVGAVAYFCRHKYPHASKSVQAFTQNLCLAPVLLIFTYLCTATSFPLRDNLLATADKMFGFDWSIWYDWAATSRVTIDTLGLLYAVVFPVQTLALVFTLPFINANRNVEIAVIFAITTAIFSAIAIVIPADGAIFYFNRVDPQLHAGLLLAFKSYTALREGTTNVIDYAQINGGMIVFPSFHAASAVLYSYAFRGSGRLFRIDSRH